MPAHVYLFLRAFLRTASFLMRADAEASALVREWPFTTVGLAFSTTSQWGPLIRASPWLLRTMTGTYFSSGGRLNPP